jgi:hypothetical protein
MDGIMTRITQEELNEVIRKHGLWLKDRSNPDGERMDLYFMDLRGLNFSNANLQYAGLHSADLRKADLYGANLQDANLRWAHLEDANLEGTVLEGADLRGANLEGANIDFSVLPLWCGGFDFKADKRIASQIAYHFCMIDCDDEEFVNARNSLLDLANKFHRIKTGECYKLEEIPVNKK